MGSSQPTISMQIDAYRASLQTFRAWLPKREQAALDRMVEDLYRAGPALNMTEDLDFGKRALLVAYIKLSARLDEEIGRLQLTEATWRTKYEQLLARVEALPLTV